MADYSIENHGSIYLIRPSDEKALKNLRENVSEEAQWFAGALAVEPRYVEQLVEQLQDEGWEVD